MIAQGFNLATGLMILAAQGFALFLMILGSIDLHSHIKNKKGKN